MCCIPEVAEQWPYTRTSSRQIQRAGQSRDTQQASVLKFPFASLHFFEIFSQKSEVLIFRDSHVS